MSEMAGWFSERKRVWRPQRKPEISARRAINEWFEDIVEATKNGYGLADFSTSDVPSDFECRHYMLYNDDLWPDPYEGFDDDRSFDERWRDEPSTNRLFLDMCYDDMLDREEGRRLEREHDQAYWANVHDEVYGSPYDLELEIAHESRRDW